MFWVYVLKSQKDNKFYTGYTKDLKRRLSKHKSGKVISTQHRGSLQLIYCEGCLSETDAIRREKLLKSGRGKSFLKNRLKFWLKSLGPNKVSG